jgi:hypothetical protein
MAMTTDPEYDRLHAASVAAQEALFAAENAERAYVKQQAKFHVGDVVRTTKGAEQKVVRAHVDWGTHVSYRVVDRKKDGHWGVGLHRLYESDTVELIGHEEP